MHEAAAKELAALPADEYARFRRALLALADDPLHARAGLDVRRIKLLRDGDLLVRLRVGRRRALYATLSAERTLLVLVVQDREIGYDRMMAQAERRPAR